MLKLYSFLVSILSFVVLPFIFVLRKLQKKDVSSWKIKLGGFNPPQDFDNSKKTIMIHGVSVGEIVSLEKLVRRVKETFPNYNLILTTGTKTGFETATKKMSDCTDFITYFPIDTPFSVNKFLNKIKPDIVLIAETEIWPVFTYNCKKRNIPIFIINGRMSDESFKAYKILKPFFSAVLPLYSGIFVQSEIDKKRLEATGANPKTLEVMKNLKFDIEKFEPKLNFEKGNFKVLIAGSTHKGEDEVVLSVFKKLQKYGVKLILAPRHLTRIEDVKKLLSSFKYNFYSENKGFLGADIILLDVMGELAKLYSMADIAFIGGSFNKTGGHNPLEAIIFNKPVISGTSIKNFRDIYSILSNAGAGFIVKNENEFFKIAEKLILDEDFYKKVSNNCETVFCNQQGALDFIIKKLHIIKF